MLCDYSFTAKAEQDLDGIIKYISEDLSNKTAAQNFFLKVFENIDTIRSYPKTGLLINNEYVSDKSVRRVLIDNYVLYYKADEELKSLTIVRIIYGKRNMTDIMQSL